jgi:DNA-binding CsgD family transcriptional regulator
MLAATLGEPERAMQHFERALDLNGRMGARTWLAHTTFEYGRFLRGRGRGERAHAEQLLAEAESLASAIDMPALLVRIESLGTATARSTLPDGLTPREVQILGLIARGLSNREIGRTLTISEHTAANHVRSILRKTDCANRTEAASYAHRHRLASI